jgi:hypothetical protein
MALIGVNGGLVGKQRRTVGLWTANEQVLLKRAGLWVNDSFFSSVSLLLHGDVVNGSTTIIDNSLLVNTVTAVGNAQISTAQSKFGGYSISLPDTTSLVDALTPGSGYSFGSGNFTVEFFGYFTHPSSQARRWVTLQGAGGYLIIRQESNNQYSFFFEASGTLYGPFLGGTVTRNAWVHIALVRNGSSWVLYVNGTSTVSRTGSETLPLFDQAGLGGFAGEHGTGFYDEVRITKGVARYTSSFTAPTAAFPDS